MELIAKLYTRDKVHGLSGRHRGPQWPYPTLIKRHQKHQ
jgi:hypothetical protein